jgi:hypothetical protein
MTFLPSSMTPSSSEVPNRYQNMKVWSIVDRLCVGYVDDASRMMMGKRGLMRRMSRMCVDDRLRWSGAYGSHSYVKIPSSVADNIRIPFHTVTGIVSSKRVNDGDWCMLVRYPVLAFNPSE